jgi:hypothetical protein
MVKDVSLGADVAHTASLFARLVEGGHKTKQRAHNNKDDKQPSLAKQKAEATQ